MTLHRNWWHTAHSRPKRLRGCWIAPILPQSGVASLTGLYGAQLRSHPYTKVKLTCKSNHVNVIDANGSVRLRVPEDDGRRLLRAGLVVARGKRVVACLQLVAGCTVVQCHEELLAERRRVTHDRLPVAEDNQTTYRDGRTVLHRWMFREALDAHPYWDGRLEPPVCDPRTVERAYA